MLILNTEQQARQRAQFAASAAHELRTPLTGLRLYGEMLRDGIEDPERSSRYAGRIAEERERLSRVVTNVLGFTRLERGTLEVNTDELDPVAKFSARWSNACAPPIESNGATLNLSEGFEGRSRLIGGLGQIVQNLVDNAEKYSRGASDRSLHMELRGTENSAEIEVRDHGPGIAPSSGRTSSSRSPGQVAGPTRGTGARACPRPRTRHGPGCDTRASPLPEGGGAAFVLTISVDVAERPQRLELFLTRLRWLARELRARAPGRIRGRKRVHGRQEAGRQIGAGRWPLSLLLRVFDQVVQLAASGTVIEDELLRPVDPRPQVGLGTPVLDEDLLRRSPAVQVGHQRRRLVPRIEIECFRQSPEETEGVHGFGNPCPTGAPSGPTDDQRNPDELLVQEPAVTPLALVIPQAFAVIRRDHHDGVICEALVREHLEELPRRESTYAISPS